MDVKKVAELARLKISDLEQKQYEEHFKKIFEYFEELKGIQTQGVEPLVTPVEIDEVRRHDISEPGLGGLKAVQNAKDKSGNLFKVPPVV